MISLKHGFLFIHIPKTAGNTIQTILKDYSEEKIVSIAEHQDGVERFEVRSDNYKIHKHSTLADYQKQLGQEVIDGLFRFTCIRNPWGRMISFYFSPHRGEILWDRAKFIRLVDEVKPVTDYISSGTESEHGTDCFGNIDHYIRFEQLERDFEEVCKRIGIPTVPLPRYNASKSEHYSAYYDNELIELVNERFSQEIKYFRFKFA